MGRNNLIAALALGAGVILSSPASADTKAGVDAWTRGDYAAAVKEWEAQSAKGDADALFNLGQAYRLGKGVPQNFDKAEALFGQAAAQGHLQAADNYGVLMFQRAESYKRAAGDRVDPRVMELKSKALPFLRAGADRGDPRAQYFLGILHFNGELVPKDWVRAYALITLSQQQGISQATSAMAQMDQYIPYEQRQEGVQLAGELASQADATRARQLAAIDLGNQVPTPAAAATVAPPPAPRPTVAVHQGPPPGVAPPQPRPVAVPAPRPAPAPPPAPSPAAGGSWRIQLGAFGVASNADALWAQIKGRPEVAGHARLNVKAGSVTKLQAGNYSQAAAQAACARLKAAGFTCVAVSG